MDNLSYSLDGETLKIILNDSCRGGESQRRIEEISALLNKGTVKKLVVDWQVPAGRDSLSEALVFVWEKAAQSAGIKAEVKNFPVSVQKMLALAGTVPAFQPPAAAVPLTKLEAVGLWGLAITDSVRKGGSFICQAASALWRSLRGRSVMRRVDFEFALENSSYKAVGIVSLVSFMVGLILAFVGSIQLRNFGAQIYVASLVAIGMTRIMGAIMAGIIMAGRTGASYAATIGAMQVNEEIDALRTMGVSPVDFLVAPRLLSLMITMPILTMLADFTGIAGGAAVGVLMLDIPAAEYWRYSVEALKMNNFLVGVFHGWIYGLIIALCGCFYGIYSGRNADGVGKATTQAVVAAIVWMIVVTGGLTWFFEAVGV